MPDYNRQGLRAAAQRFASAMRTVAAVKTRRTADAVNISYENDEVSIRAGKPEGVYGWSPIQAVMFDNNLRHPLFGNKAHWYNEGRYPITAYTERSAIDSATEDYTKGAVDPLLKDHGFK